jgi:hypothetical protein
VAVGIFSCASAALAFRRCRSGPPADAAHPPGFGLFSSPPDFAGAAANPLATARARRALDARAREGKERLGTSRGVLALALAPAPLTDDEILAASVRGRRLGPAPAAAANFNPLSVARAQAAARGVGLTPLHFQMSDRARMRLAMQGVGAGGGF